MKGVCGLCNLNLAKWGVQMAGMNFQTRSRNLDVEEEVKLNNFSYNIFRILAFRRCSALSVDFSSRPSTLAIWL